jgi:Holliday junction DNA helicase RuvB
LHSEYTDPHKLSEDVEVEQSVRPSAFSEFVGQTKVVENLQLYISAAKERGEALDHVLLFGPPGLGKTTLAHIVSRELNVNIRTTSGPVIERAGDLAGMLTNLAHGDVFFIDEIHRLNNVVEEYLYSAMEDYTIAIVIDKGPNARNIQLNLEPFTLIGATTRLGHLTSPMRDRFGVVLRLDYYTSNDLFNIINRSARILNINIEPAGATEIARRARGTPRIANRILRRARDYAQIKGKGKINKSIAEQSLQLLDIDERGLDNMDRTILTTIVEKFAGGPVGLNSLAVAVGEDPETIEDVYEPFLIQNGLLQRTARGRLATRETFKYFGLKLTSEQQSLFE